jgi:hypothetical protein
MMSSRTHGALTYESTNEYMRNGVFGCNNYTGTNRDRSVKDRHPPGSWQ